MLYEMDSLGAVDHACNRKIELNEEFRSEWDAVVHDG